MHMKKKILDLKSEIFLVVMLELLFIVPSIISAQNLERTLHKAEIKSVNSNLQDAIPVTDPDTVVSLPVILYPQESRNWCWAACAQMIMEYMGTKISQCKQANDRLEQNDCCKKDSAFRTQSRYDSLENYFKCQQPGWPQFEKYGFTYKRRLSAPLTWKELKLQLSDSPERKGMPFAFSWRWENGGGHMMIVKGFAVMEGEKYVIILDPWPPDKGDEVIITYSAYVYLLGNYTHWDDFYDISNTGLN